MFPRSKTIKETYDFIINDLTEAAEGLPVTASAGALTKGAAYALKAAVCLQGAAFLTDSNEKRDYYQQAKKACEDLFALGIYSLESDYGKLFNDYSTGLSSKEVILATYYLSETTRMSGTWMQSIVPNQGAGKIPEEVLLYGLWKTLRGGMINLRLRIWLTLMRWLMPTGMLKHGMKHLTIRISNRMSIM